MKGLKLAAQRHPAERTVVRVGDLRIGRDFVIIAGPCSVEDEEQTLRTARLIKEAGAQILRGGAFKPRMSPYDFQGLGEDGLRILKAARDETGLPVVTEVMDARHLDMVQDCADILQVGSRNMQNYTLLKELGRAAKPVLLKRGMNATLEEWLNAAEYVLAGGNADVILCERGIRTFETYTRNTLDLSSVPSVKELSHLPVVVDPSHATGRASLVRPMCLAAVAAGADGVMVEVHPHPSQALSDKNQQLTPESFAGLARAVRDLVAFMAAQSARQDKT
jgi:3-deoxy-7-phosphoheptulonate synthase